MAWHTYSSTPVLRGLGSNRSARGLLISLALALAPPSSTSSSVLSVTGDEFPVTEVVIPASLVEFSSGRASGVLDPVPFTLESPAPALGACVWRRRDSTRVHNSSVTTFGLEVTLEWVLPFAFVLVFTLPLVVLPFLGLEEDEEGRVEDGSEDSGAVAEDSESASLGGAPADVPAFLDFFFFFFAGFAAASASVAGSAKPPGTTWGKGTTIGCGG